MNSLVRLCYMCNSVSTTDDHVPPKCIFPERKDSGDLDYRINLITIPSCEAHNNRVSGDDQAFFTVVSIHLQNNLSIQEIQKQKILRTFRRDRKLWKRFIGHNRNYLVKTPEGLAVLTILDTEIQDGFFRSCDKIARGLFYHRHKFQWRDEVLVVPLNLAGNNPTNSYRLQRDLAKRLSNVCSSADLKKRGQNPEVFYFQELMGVPSVYTSMRLVFYEGAEIILMFPDVGYLKSHGILQEETL
jgi:hypothetical protein